MGKPFTIRFEPEGREVHPGEPLPLADAAAMADVLIDHPCGSNATCGKCRVRFIEGAPGPTPADTRLLRDEDLRAGWRLACQCECAASAVVEVPAVSRAATGKSFGDASLFASGLRPFVTHARAAIPEPSMDEQHALEDLLARAMGVESAPEMGVEQLNDLSLLAASGGVLEVVLDDGNVVELARSAGSEPPVLAGLAVDVGSTSVAAALVDLVTGGVLAQASVLNPQVRFGGDVISRIEHAMSHDEGNAQLHVAVVEAVNDLLTLLCSEAGLDPALVRSVCAAGNPAMLHTLLGVDVRPLGQAPYVGAWSRGLRVPARAVGLELAEGVHLRTMPMIRSNVGGDTVAAVVASGMDAGDDLSLMIDLGTNSEIVLGNRTRLIATSTAAGPAFEGANIRQGMRAAPGAIDRVSLRADGAPRIRVIGGGRALGLCGSALIDAVAVLLRTGLIDEGGRMHGRGALDERRYPGLAARVVTGEHGHPCVVLATPEEGEGGTPVMLSALDVRQLQLIKGSIMAGARMLMEAWGCGPDDLRRVLIAGAFGQFVRKRSLLDIGMVPQVDPERVEFIGNAAGVGARMALADRDAWERAVRVGRVAEYLELGGHPEYQYAFAECMGFHDTPAVEARFGERHA